MINNKAKKVIENALREDRVRNDKTTLLTVPAGKKSKAVIAVKEKGVLCGIELAEFSFYKTGKKIRIKKFARDGDFIKKNQKIMNISGDLRTILKAERVALNFLSLLSGIATATKILSGKVKTTKVKIKDTRKTTPGLRMLEKYAVLTGGGQNHRHSLADGIIVKDNHLRAFAIVNKKNRIDHRQLKKTMQKIRKSTRLKIEIEVESFQEFVEVAKHKPNVIMLDNFSKKDLVKAVRYRNEYFPAIELEASGRITFQNIYSVAAAGVDSISVGYITHSPQALDFSLEII